ncbi:hypothetical protein PMAYCL1PPCAC_29508, partial [Pristionchus mayeri]
FVFHVHKSMVRNPHGNSPRLIREVIDADDGRGFDEYIHEEYPNPLETAARIRRKEREKQKKLFSSSLSWLLQIPIFICLFCVITMAVSYHHKLHSKNDCRMTFIYRSMIFNPIDVRGNNVEKYSLVRYHEGYRDESVLNIDIPVLFVPGSSGSAKQIRSLATTVMNNTAELGNKIKFRYVFYACDFDEEFSFLSGATLIRQRDFVVKSIETIIQMYSGTGVKKLVLVGHSFGGTILHSLPAHPRVDLKWMDLVVTLGSPINGPPFNSDYYMETFYQNTIKAWETRTDELTQITLVSYSGGLKDFMVPDHLARSPFKYNINKFGNLEMIAGSRDTRVIFRPSWSLREVGCEVDHNCLAWCNQLVKHISKMLVEYGLDSWQMPREGMKKTSRKFVKDFYRNGIGRERPARKYSEPLFNSSLYVREDNRKVNVSEEFPYVAIKLDLHQYDLIVHIRARSFSCPPGVVASLADLTFRYVENLTAYGTRDGEWVQLRIMPVFSETDGLKGTVRIGGTPGCEYEMEASCDVSGTVYRRLMDSTTLPLVVYYTLFLSAFIPMARLNRVPPPFHYLYSDLPYYLFAVVCLFSVIYSAYVFLSIPFSFMLCLRMRTMSYHWLVERNLLPFLMWGGGARLATLLIAKPLQPLVRTVCQYVDRSPSALRMTARFLLVGIAVYGASYNVNLGYAFLLFLYIFKVGGESKNGLALIIFSICILLSIGLAGNVRDGAAGIFQHSWHELSSKDFLESLYIVLYGHPHPLLFSFISCSFCFLINNSKLLQGMRESMKEKISGVLYVLLLLSARVSNLEAMAISTCYYVLLFEMMKEYQGLGNGDGIFID